VVWRDTAWHIAATDAGISGNGISNGNDTNSGNSINSDTNNSRATPSRARPVIPVLPAVVKTMYVFFGWSAWITNFTILAIISCKVDWSGVDNCPHAAAA
jgi:hypothetical protein